MKPTYVRVISVLGMLLLAASVVGCQQVAEKATEAAIEKSTGVDVEKSGDEVTITGEDGTEITASSDGQLPDGFPSDIPVYEGPITSSIKADKGWSVTIEAADDVDTIFSWYKQELEKSGWKVVSEMKVTDGAAVVAEKGDQNVQVTIGTSSSDAGASTLSLFVSTK